MLSLKKVVRRNGSARPFFRPRLESLESRLAPAVFTQAAGQSHLIPHKKAKNGLARFVVPACLQALLLDAAFGRFVLPQ